MVRIIDVVIGILIFGIVSSLIFSFWGDLGENYGVPEYSNYTGYYDNVKSGLNYSEEIAYEMQSLAKEDIGFSTLGAIKNIVVNAFKMPINALITATTLITQTINEAGLPGDEIAMVGGAIIAIIIIFIIWKLLLIFFGRID